MSPIVFIAPKHNGHLNGTKTVGYVSCLNILTNYFIQLNAVLAKNRDIGEFQMQEIAQVVEIAQATDVVAATAKVLNIKDYFQIGTWIIGMIVGCLAIYKGFYELSQSRLLRERELRWSQAKVAKDLLSEFEANDEYKRACRMLDWKKYCFQLEQGESHTVTRAEVLHALRIEELVFTDKERYIRESFIELFHCFEWLEHFVARDLIGLEDVKPVLAYRVESMVFHLDVFKRFLKKYGYTEAVGFLERFDSWA